MPVEWHEVRRFCYSVPTALPAERVPLGESCGRRLASDMVALCDVPHYASSAMDGWAVAGDPPWRVVQNSLLGAGEASAILTGGEVPDGATAILRSERGETSEAAEERILMPAEGEPPPDGENIREPGEEVRVSDAVFPWGALLGPAHVAVAAVCGHDDLPVLARPRVALVLTGNEVVETGVPAPGRVRDTFGPQLGSFVGLLGGAAGAYRRTGDDLAQLTSAIAAGSAESDVVVTTGGTGRSVADHLHPALDALGANILVDGVAMRPGHPCVLARFAEGGFLVGLPGNPLAAMMGMLTLVQPLLAGLQSAAEPALGQVVVGNDLPEAGGRNRLVPYQLVDGVAVPSRWRGSGMLRGLAEADGVLVGPPAGARAGEQVEALDLPW